MVVLALLYVALPLWAKFTVFIINAFVPDIIPAFDEIFMMASTINHMMKIFATRQWISEHKKNVALCDNRNCRSYYPMHYHFLNMCRISGKIIVDVGSVIAVSFVIREGPRIITTLIEEGGKVFAVNIFKIIKLLKK